MSYIPQKFADQKYHYLDFMKNVCYFSFYVRRLHEKLFQMELSFWWEKYVELLLSSWSLGTAGDLNIMNWLFPYPQAEKKNVILKMTEKAPQTTHNEIQICIYKMAIIFIFF